MKSTTTSNQNEKILVLGHRGLLGSQVISHLRRLEKSTETTQLRWPDPEFKEYIIQFSGTIVNCAGAIPQSGTRDFCVNHELPIFLLESNKKIIQPDTDCVFSGRIGENQSYGKTDLMDAEGPYPESKIRFNIESSEYVDTLRIIRTSIVGFDNQSKSLLSWFLKTAKETGDCRGYVNHFWNGITTLQWAKIANDVIENWSNYDRLTQVGSDKITKHDLLMLFSEVFGVSCRIEPLSTDVSVNKCLRSDLKVPSIRFQIEELFNNTKSIY